MSRKLEFIYQQFKTAELELSQSGQISEDSLHTLVKSLEQFKDHKDVNYFKLASIPFHLKANMSLKDLVNWMLPIERLLKKNLKDEDFLIFNTDSIDLEKKAQSIPLVLVLDNLRSSFNVGSIFRTAEAFNVEHIYLCGYTPDPTNSKTSKTTLGSENYIPWSTHTSTLQVLQLLKSKGYFLIAAETTDHAQNLESEFLFSTPSAFVFGNERFGLDAEVIKACDQTRKVMLTGIKNSLNVANCASLFIYEFSKQYVTKK